MKTSKKNAIVYGVFTGLAIFWCVAGAVATNAKTASIAFWVAFAVLLFIALLFGVAGIGAERAEKRASKK